MDAEALELADAGFDVVLCALGLMYVPDPARALREMRRVLRPGGRVVLAVWGERARCGWSPVFPIVDAEVASEVCPLFFAWARATLAALCAQAGLHRHREDAARDDAALRRCRRGLRRGVRRRAGRARVVALRRGDARARARQLPAAIEPWRDGEAIASRANSSSSSRTRRAQAAPTARTAPARTLPTPSIAPGHAA